MNLSAGLRQQCVNTIRFLSADGVEAAQSGHPGTPMGAADIGFVIWNEFLRYSAQNPQWIGRDRFVLSAGHASMLLYSLLHLSGYDLPLEELKQFRQYESLTPGHPEYGHTAGVECTTGPLGAGFSNAVGMALASQMLGSRFNTPDFPLVDSKIYTLCSDGDIQEGITAEAASLAGHLGLGNLIVVYDSNHITIAGELDLSMSEDTGKRFESYGWHVQSCDGHDHKALRQCLNQAKQNQKQPSLIIAQTVIGKGAPKKAGTEAVHGAPLGAEELRNAKLAAQWPLEPFHVPQEVAAVFAQRTQENHQVSQEWHQRYNEWRHLNPYLASLWDQHWASELPPDLCQQLVQAVASEHNATRNLSGMVIQELAKHLPQLVGGSGDLEPSTLTLIKKSASIQRNSFEGRNIHFGIREHAMGGISNGMNLFGGFRTFCATFAVFSDYMRASVRLAAISKVPTIFVYTHDSFYVGEDGPTHQPIEQLASLRLIPNLEVWRPADAMETAVAWYAAVESEDHPTALFLTRQKVINLKRHSHFKESDLLKGGYLVQDSHSIPPQITLISTGSEGELAVKVQERLQAGGIATRHVSMPCVERFRVQSPAYIKDLLPATSTVIAIEAGVSASWYEFADFVIGKDSFGASAPSAVLQDVFGFTVEKVVSQIKKYMELEG